MKRKLATIMFILCFLGTACSNVSLDSSELKEPIEEENLESPQYGGTINLATTSKLDLDPLKANDDEIKGVLSLIYEGLVYIDGQGMVQPALTESWQIGDNGRTYVMKLRTDVKWHNGEDFSASDVKATFDKILELKKQRDFRTEFLEFDNIQSYEASDENTFTISLSKPDANFLYRMDRGILPKSLLETVEVNEGQNIEEPVSEFIGTGPFIVTDRSGDLINLKRNEDYFGEIPYIEKINIRIYPDELSIKEAFTKGDIDIITIEPMDWNVFQEMEDVYLLQTPSRYLEFLAVNLNNPILNDVKVRQAMLMGIDRNRILQDTVIGRGLAMDGPVFPYSWAFNSQIQPIPHNKKRAAQLLESAGWETEGDEILVKTIGNRKYKLEFELLVNTDNVARYQAASHIEKNLGELGISVKLVNMTWDELKDRVMSKKYDTALMGWKLAPNPDLMFMFASSEIRNGYNFVSYSNPELDDILLQAQTQDEKRRELLYKAQEIISRDLPYLFLYSPNTLLALKSRLRGVTPDPINLYNNINQWWVVDP